MDHLIGAGSSVESRAWLTKPACAAESCTSERSCGRRLPSRGTDASGVGKLARSMSSWLAASSSTRMRFACSSIGRSEPVDSRSAAGTKIDELRSSGASFSRSATWRRMEHTQASSSCTRAGTRPRWSHHAFGTGRLSRSARACLSRVARAPVAIPPDRASSMLSYSACKASSCSGSQ